MDKPVIVFPEEPKFKTKLSPKAYRESAIMWQLKALKAQTEAVTAIAAEHSIKLDDINPRTLCQRTDDIIATAVRICDEAPKTPAEKIFELIKVLRQTADELRADGALFAKVANFRAAFRLSGMLPSLAAQIHTGAVLLPKTDESVESEPEDRDALCCDHQKLAVASARRCYEAESEQHHTFSLQINAICDLAMEMVLAAAAEKSDKE
jgi:hypothetical protein